MVLDLAVFVNERRTSISHSKPNASINSVLRERGDQSYRVDGHTTRRCLLGDKVLAKHFACHVSNGVGAGEQPHVLQHESESVWITCTSRGLA